MFSLFYSLPAGEGFLFGIYFAFTDLYVRHKSSTVGPNSSANILPWVVIKSQRSSGGASV